MYYCKKCGFNYSNEIINSSGLCDECLSRRNVKMNSKMLTVDSAIFKKYEDEIERLQKENENLKQYKKVLMENSVVRSEKIEELEKALLEIGVAVCTIKDDREAIHGIAEILDKYKC